MFFLVQDSFKYAIEVLEFVVNTGTPIATNPNAPPKPPIQEFLDKTLMDVYHCSSSLNYRTNPLKSFYKGLPSKSKKSCFYLNISRLSKKNFEKSEIGLFLYEFSKHTKDEYNNSFCLIIDMSFVGIPPIKERDSILTIIDDILVFIPQEFVYIVLTLDF
jgi:hypothetical protein